MKVAITQIARADAFYDHKNRLIGQVGEIADDDIIMIRKEGKLKGYAKDLQIVVDGRGLYFYAVKFLELKGL